ncbi:MAG: hypothetical protein V1721_03455 [Pseudomonadota bacterium]
MNNEDRKKIQNILCEPLTRREITFSSFNAAWLAWKKLDNEGKKKIENILDVLPLTRHRIDLNNRIEAAKREKAPQPFEFKDLEKILEGISDGDPSFKQEASNILEAVQTGRAPKPVDLGTPEKQFGWAAGIAYLSVNQNVVKKTVPDTGMMLVKKRAHLNAGQGEAKAASKAGLADESINEMLARQNTEADREKAKAQEETKDAEPSGESTRVPGVSVLWKQVTNSPKAQEELLYHVRHVEKSLQGRKTQFAWGEPGTGFIYDRKKNIISIDLMQALTVGVEHARAGVYREIGQALLSLTYPKSMQDIYAEMQPLSEKQEKAQKGNGPELTQDEYRNLRILGAKWGLRERMFKAAEETAANRFVFDLQTPQDHSVSLNIAAVTQGVAGVPRSPEDGDFGKEAVYNNLCKAVRLSFFQRNGLFPDEEDEWLKNGVDPRKVRKTAPSAEGAGAGNPDFLDLRRLCVKLESPDGKSIESFDRSRKEVIGEIMALYGEELIQGILKQTEKKLDRELDEAKRKTPEEDKPGSPDGEKPDGEKTGEAPDAGTPGSEDTPAVGEQHGNDPPGGDIPDDGEAKGLGGNKDDDKKGKEGAEGDDEAPDGDKNDELGTDKKSFVKVEGLGDMPAVINPLEKPGDDKSPDKGMDADKSDPCAKTAPPPQGKEDDAPGEGDVEEGTKRNVPNDNPDAKACGGGDNAYAYTLGDLSSPERYAERVGRLHETIAVIRNVFGSTVRTQNLPDGVVSDEYSFFPKDTGSLLGDISWNRHFNLVVNQAKGTTEIEDWKQCRQREDTIIRIPSTLFIIVDRSGSMGQAEGGKPSPLQSAMQICISLVEGAKREKIRDDAEESDLDVYVGLLGPRNPSVIIRPGDSPSTIARAIEAAHKSPGTGTDFAPAVEKIAETIGGGGAETIGTAEAEEGLVGSTHVVIISDGKVHDKDEARESIATLLGSMSGATLDIVILSTAENRDKRVKVTQIEDLVKSINGDGKTQSYSNIGVHRVKDASEAVKIAEVLCNRIREDECEPVTRANGKSEAKKAYEAMKASAEGTAETAATKAKMRQQAFVL